MQPSPTELRLIEGWQRHLPLSPRPFALIARELGTSERDVLAMLANLQSAGIISRVGAVVRPNTAGSSTLAAMSVPPGRLEEVAGIVSSEPGVNHNYEREHPLNLWFVVTARDRIAVLRALARLRAVTELDVLDLPLERSYFIDLGFALGSGARASADGRRRRATRPANAADRRLLAAIEDGLPLVSRPFEALAPRLATTEADVIAHFGELIEAGIITRLGIIVRHRAVGYVANAMAVWDISDDCVDAVGERLAAEPFVTLCYRRPRRPPAWPHNLFCMVHGREREVVRQQVRLLALLAGIDEQPHALLFSRRCFKQRGARLAA